MAASTNRSLFLTIGGDATPVVAATKAARTALLELGGGATDIMAEVQKALDGVRGDGLDRTLRQIDADVSRTIAGIRRNVQAAASAPNGVAAATILNVAGAEQAAAAAEAEASEMRVLAATAATLAERLGDAGTAQRQLAVSFAVAASQRGDEAVQLRGQADALKAIATEAGITTVAHDELGHATKRMSIGQMEMMHVVRSSSDAFAAGAPLAQIFAMEIGRVAEAAAYSDGALGKVSAVMAGPWGLAFTVGLAVLTPFFAKLLEGNDELGKAVEKLKDEARQTDLSNAAHQAFSRTLEGQIALQRDLNKELDRSIQSERQQQEVKLRSAQQNGEGLQKSRSALLAQIAEQQKIVDTFSDVKAGKKTTSYDDYGLLAQAAARAQQAIENLRLQVIRADQSIADNGRTIRQAELPLVKDDVATAFDKRAAAVAKYNRELSKLDIRRTIGEGKSATVQELATDGKFYGVRETGISREQYRTQLAAITAERKAAEEAAASAKKTASENRQFGREIDLTQARSIVAAMGGRVTNDVRSHEKQQQLYADHLAGRHPGPVAKPGISDHEFGQALDVAYGLGISVASIKKAFAAQGVALKKVLDEPTERVFHVAWGKKGPSQETTDKRADAAEQKRIRDDEAFAQAKGRAQEEQLQLFRGQVSDIAAAADLDARSIEIEHRRLDSAAQAGVAEKKWSQAKADQLIQLNQANSELKIEAVRRRETQDLLQQQLATDVSDLQSRQALLEIQGRLAKTRKGQLDVALQLLAIQEQILAKQANEVLRNPNASREDKDKAIDTLKAIDDQHAGKKSEIENAHLDKMQLYRDQLKQNVGDMNDALKGVEADGLRGLEDGLMGILDGTESVADAFKKMADAIIADLIRIAIEKLILNIIGFGFKDGNVPDIAGAATGHIPGFASGLVDGIIRGPGTGRSDSILGLYGNQLIRVSNGESIMTEAATNRYRPMLKAMNDNSLPGFATGLIPDAAMFMPSVPDPRTVARAGDVTREVIYIQIDKSELFDAHVQRAAAPLAQAAVVGGSQMAQADLAERRLQIIPT